MICWVTGMGLLSLKKQTYQEVWLKNGNFMPAAGHLSNYNQSNLAAAIILTCYISLIKAFTVAVFSLL